MRLKTFNMRVFASILLVLCATGSVAGEVQGVLRWSGKTDLSLPVSGVVDEVLVRPGQAVKQGQVMLKLDKRRVKARLRAAEARVARFKPGRDEAQRELERAKELFDRTVLSEVELQQAKIDFAEKNAALQEARAELVGARLDLEYSELKAPFDLIVLHVFSVKGQVVINALQPMPLISVARDRLMVSAPLPVAKLSGVDIGQQVTVTYDGKTTAGSVSRVTYDSGRRQSVLRISIADQQVIKGGTGYPVLVTWP